MSSRLQSKLKLALDETRLLVLGAQVLFGFQFEGAFQELFSELSPEAKVLQCVGLALLLISVGCLLAPSMNHQLACSGEWRA